MASGTTSDDLLEYTLKQTNTSISGSTILYCIDTTDTCTPNINYTDKVYSKNNGSYYFRFQITSGAGKKSSGSYRAIVNDTTYCAVNLIKNGSFEDGIEEWGNFTETTSISNGNYSSYGIHPKYGDKNLRVAFLKDDQLFLRAYFSLPDGILLQGHKVYGKVSTYKEYQFHEYINPGIYLVFSQTPDLWSPVGTVITDWYGNHSTEYTKWIDLSLYSDNTPYNYLNVMLSQSTDTNVKGGIIHFDGLTVIDLTDTFGAGNEPSKEWCDNNLSWFEGKKIIYK